MEVVEDKVLRQDGSEGIYAYIRKPPFSLIIPFDGVHLTLVQQLRYPVGKRYWEFPQGSLETSVEASYEEIARQELAEETGLVASKVTILGKLYNAYGMSNQEFAIFLAEELSETEAKLEPTELDLVSGKFSLSEVHKMIDNAEIRDAATVAALYLWQTKNQV